MAVITQRCREAHGALSSVIEQYADVFAPDCEAHEEETCGCPRPHLMSWALAHEWVLLESDETCVAWHAGLGTSYAHAIGLFHVAIEGR
jgi:hypothetical protein